MASVSNWKFFDQNVQSGLLEGRFMNAAYTMIAAGPPRLAATAIPAQAALSGASAPPDLAYPIGVLQSFNMGASSQWLRLWEIGSERSYFVRGRTQGQVSLSRLQYHGPNILRVLYAYLGDTNGEGFGAFRSLYANSAKSKLNTAGTGGSKARYVNAPGHKNLWMDLASDVFSQPIGLLLYMRDSNEDTVGAFYIEYCNVQNYGMSTDAAGTVISEQTSLLYERIRPVNLQSVALIADSTSIQSVVGANVIGSAAGPALGGV